MSTIAISDLRRFVEQDCDVHLENALRDAGIAAGFMTIADSCPHILRWVEIAQHYYQFAEEVIDKLTGIHEMRHRISYSKFPAGQVSQDELEAIRRDIQTVVTWLRAKEE